ncbi:cleft lip and palate transmembrane protein 1-domain-containing protein [Thamnidium elegans]|nr:cleft lip and palate transmembrane protein 1-domain-containing protein [Thamnidium elegans]
MADDNKVAAPVTGPATTAQGPQEKTFLQKYGGSIAQMVIFWLVMQLVTKGFQTSVDVAVKPDVTSDDATKPAPEFIPGVSTLRDYANVPDNVFYFTNPSLPLSDVADTYVPLWPHQTPMDVTVFVSEDEHFTDYQRQPDWTTTDIYYGEDFEPREHRIEIPATKSIQHNGTVYAHIFVSQAGKPLDPTKQGFVPDATVYARHALTKFYPQKTIVKQKKLLGKSEKHEEEEEEEEKKVEQIENIPVQQQQEDNTAGSIVGLGAGLIGNLTRRAPLVAYWHPNVTLSLVSNSKAPLPKNGLQPPVMRHVQFDYGLSRTPDNKVGFYRPILFPNDFWVLQQNAYAVNETITTLPLNIRVEPISMWKFNIYATLDESMKQQSQSALGGMSSGDMDEVKRMFIETNPILLGTTIAVSCLHSLFEMLAFKNDIAFWKQKSNSAGISVRTLIVNIFFQIVIFLYLFDNNQETSWMVLISQGFGLVIELWKVFKALKYELIWTPGSFIPSLGQQAVEQTDVEDETAKYDAIAFKYLKWLSYPLLAGYAMYSLYYDEHKSWYSFVIHTLVQFVYMFGFITMLPQLYINYRLKSVAHMPWRTLMYKSLNTFIDDLFAFVIKMPTLHRLACLRDDFVFFVYLYQRHAYKVDPTRANEYGQVGGPEDKNESDKDKESKKDK